MATTTSPRIPHQFIMINDTDTGFTPTSSPIWRNYTSMEFQIGTFANMTFTLNASDDDDEGDINYNPADCTVYNFIVSGFLVGLICILGYIGNILTIVTLSQQKKSGIRILLQSLAVVDTVLLIPALLVKCVANTCLFIGPYGETCFSYWFSIYPFLTAYVWPVGTIAHFSTVWITVLVTGNRYIAVCRPLQAKTLTRVSYVYVQLAIVILFAIGYCIPRFFEYGTLYMIHPDLHVPIYITTINDLFKDKAYQIIYKNISFFLIMNIIPFIVLTIFTVFLVRAVWRARKTRSVMIQSVSTKSEKFQKEKAKEDTSLTFTLIMVVVVFFVCQLPAAITRISFIISPNINNECGRFYAYFSHLSDFLVFLNSAVNFIIYCVCSSKFRADLRKVFSRRSCEKSGGSRGYMMNSSAITYRTNIAPITRGKTLSNGDVKGSLSNLKSSSQLSMASFPSVLSLPEQDDKDYSETNQERDGVSCVSQETIVTHL